MEFLRLAFIIGVWTLISVESCGVTTHNVIAHRAAYWFQSNEYPEYSKYIMKHQDAFQIGAAFPDWGYACPLGEFLPQLPNASECAHWPPFQKTFSEYIRLKYPEPYTEKGEKLVAFLLGVTSHAIADILWHDLPKKVGETFQGFIQSMADMDYRGSYPTAHSEADIGGEFMCAYEIDISFLVDIWYLPSEDLTEIYKLLGFTEVSPIVIDTCVAELYAEIQAIKNLPSELLYPYFASKAPFLVDQFQDWWDGGVNDMAVWTTWCWPNIIDWLEVGPNKNVCLIEYNDTWPGLTLKSRTQRREQLVKSMAKYTDKFRDAVTISHTEDGMTAFALEEAFASKLKKTRSPKNALPSKRDSSCVTQTGTGNSFTIITDWDYSQLGRAMSVGDFNKDGYDDIAIGAPGAGEPGDPQAGAVFIIYGRPGIIGQQSVIVGQGHYQNVTSIFGKYQRARLGWAVGNLDFNLDGYLDLAVAQPGIDANQLGYKGQVLIYFGHPSGFSSSPDITIESVEVYTNLAQSIQVGDVGGDGYDDLILGAPFGHLLQNGTRRVEVGEVWVFYSSHHRKTGQKISEDMADVRLSGERAYDWFGYHTEVVNLESSGDSLLLVGAPAHDNGNFTVGRIYAYDLDLVGKKRTVGLDDLPLKWQITGTTSHSHLAMSFSTGNPLGNGTLTYIALGIPTQQIDGEHWYDPNKYQAGRVILFPIDNLSGNYTIDDINPLAIFDSDEDFSRLGSVVSFSPVKNTDGSQTLWITEPYRDSSWFDLPQDGDAGATYLWKGGLDFPTGLQGNMKSSSTLCVESNAPKSLYGFAAVMLDFDGDGLEDLALGGPRDRTVAMNAGSVTIMLGALDQK